jgi:hypothetical protein
MTNSNVDLKHGDQYIVFYTGGPYDGQSDTRISTDGGWDEQLTVLVALDGKETQLDYVSPVVKLVGDQVQVTYTWDQADSEQISDGEERVSEE